VRNDYQIYLGGIPMNNLYTAVTKKDGNWWVGWVSEVPGVNCQERTHEELLKEELGSLTLTISFSFL